MKTDITESKNEDKSITPQPKSGSITVIVKDGGTIGVLNTGNIKEVDKINVSINQLKQNGEDDLATSIKTINDAIFQSKELNDKVKEEVLEQLIEISEQANLPEDKRLKKSILKAIFNGIETALNTVTNLAEIWGTWGTNISTFFHF
jgi:cobalamin-dependent methionine synthase I